MWYGQFLHESMGILFYFCKIENGGSFSFLQNTNLGSMFHIFKKYHHDLKSQII